jgi:hypothetical protein
MSKIIIPFILSLTLLFSCDKHTEFPDNSLAPGHILCTDGDILNYDSFKESYKEAIAVVFYVNHDENIEGKGYAVYLWDLAPTAFADSTGVSQKTSADITALDGNENTYSMYANRDVSSPLAKQVYDLWKYGQSAYIPSVAQMRYLKAAKLTINSYITVCGGQPLSDEADECWYWTSTEVSGQEADKAWLYSLKSGIIQETPKLHEYKSRPIISINY